MGLFDSVSNAVSDAWDDISGSASDVWHDISGSANEIVQTGADWLINPFYAQGKKLFGGLLGGDSGPTTSTTTAQPWYAQQPYLKDIYTRSYLQEKIPLAYYPETTVARFTPEQERAYNMIKSRALQGSPLLGSSQEYIQDVLEGKYLTPESNPYLPYYVERGFEQSIPAWDTSAIEAGRYGSDVWALGKGRTLADIVSNVYGGAYETERGRMGEAATLAPQLAQMDYYDAEQLAKIGAEKQAMEQALIDAAREKWEFEQLEPWMRLGMYSNLISGDVGGKTTSTA